MLKILIVDDSSTMRKIIKKSIEKTNYEVDIIECSNGKEALDVIDENIDCIFLDINMPVMTGFELIEELKVKNYLNKLNIVIASTNTLTHKYMNENSIFSFITKPFTVLELDNSIVSILDTLSSKNSIDLKIEKKVLVLGKLSTMLIISKILKELGFSEVFETDDYRKAIEIISENIDIDIIFINLNIPLENAEDFITTIDKANLIDNMKIVALHNENSEDLEFLEDNEEIEYRVLKPATQESIKNTVSKMYKQEVNPKALKDSSEKSTKDDEDIVNLDEDEPEDETLKIDKDTEGELTEIKPTYTVEDSIRVYLSKYKKLIEKNSNSNKDPKQFDFRKMKRFIYTAYFYLIDIDVSLKSNKELLEAFNYLKEMEKSFKVISDMKKFSVNVAYNKMFLALQEHYVYFNKQFHNLDAEVAHTRKKITIIHEKLQEIKKEVDESIDRESNECKQKIKMFKSLNKDYADLLYKVNVLKNNSKNLKSLLKDFKERYKSTFKVIYLDKIDEVEGELFELLNIYSYVFDYKLWEKARVSSLIKQFFIKSEIDGNFSTQTFLEYYLRTIDKNKTNEENLKLFDLLEYLQAVDNKNIAVVTDELYESEALKETIMNINKSYKVFALIGYKKLLDRSLPKQDLIVIDSSIKDLNLKKFVKDYKIIYEIPKKENIKLLIIFDRYDKNIIINSIEDSLINAKLKNYIIKPKHLIKKEIERKVNSII